jgi:uncharacterized protein YoxC
LKVLIGNTDVEDALQRLNNLTEEEARIASAELWRTTHSLGEGVQDVARDVEDIVDEVQYFHDRVESIDEGVQDVFDTVQYVNVRLQGVGHGVQDIGHNVQSVRDSVDSANRQPFLNAVVLASLSHISSQGTSSEIAFEAGYHLRIRPQITTFCVKLISREQPTGSLVTLFSMTGNPLVLSCGYTEIVSSSYHFPCDQF